MHEGRDLQNAKKKKNVWISSGIETTWENVDEGVRIILN